MFCPHCGKPVEDGTLTCPFCGASLPSNAQQKASAPIYTRPPVADPPLLYQSPYQSSEMPVIQLMRRMVRSPFFLVPAIAYTCMVVLSLMDSLLRNSTAAINNTLAMVAGNSYEMNRMLGNLYDLVPVINSTSAGAVLIGNIPVILIAVGIWMTFASAANRSGAPLQTAGLTMIRVILIIRLVLCALMAVLMLVLLAAFVSSMGAYEDTSVVVAVFLVLFVLVAGILALLLLYYVQLIRMVDGFRRSIRTGNPSGKIFVYVAVMSILGGAVSLFSALSGGVIYALSNLGGAVSGIGFGIFLFRCRAEFLKISASADAWHAR